jgi:hypothetical protein
MNVNTPLIDALLPANWTEKFHTSIQKLETGIAENKIWNTDLNDAKYILSSAAEKVIDNASEPWKTNWYATRGDFRWPAGWAPDDVREAIIYHPQFSNTPGAVKRLSKFEGQDPLYDQFIAVLKEVALLAELVKAAKPFAVKGRKPNPNAVAPDLSNTGICPVCMRRQKLRFNATLVDHGYELKYGSRNGVCLGARFKAWELSPEGGVYYLESLHTTEDYFEQEIAGLDTATSLPYTVRVKIREKLGISTYRDETRTMENTDPAFPKLVQRTRDTLTYQIGQVQADIKEVDKRVKEWQKQPLMYGGAETQERWKSKLLK